MKCLQSKLESFSRSGKMETKRAAALAEHLRAAASNKTPANK